ncbi:MAG: glycosyltransferase family 4 protein [Planctomycetaceae bacterium]|nr:glycosyltransferase family 4 protein [Planctomycetaceae bacterium]
MSSTRKLTVVQILPALEGGGVERGVVEVADALVRAGHRSLVISAGGRMVDELTRQGSEHFTCNLGSKSPLTLRHIPWLRRFFKEQRVDLIDAHSRMPAWISLMTWKTMPKATRPAFLTSMHGLHSVGFYSSVMCRGERVIAVSQTLYDHIREHYSFVPPDRLDLIHRGIDSKDYPRGFQPDQSWREAFEKQYPETVGKPLITLAGRITRLKGHEDMLRMLHRLQQKGIAAHGLIVGGADPRKAGYAEEMKALASSLGLSSQVTFTGHRSDLKQIYAISSVVLSLSTTPESFGRTVAEALSIGTPVVGYNHGGVAEILAAQFPEGAVPLGDADRLELQVSKILLASPRPVPGPNVFEKSTMLEKTLEVYEKMVRR